MDSKRMRRAMAGMIVVFLTVFAVIAIVNWDTVKRKLGFATEEPVQEEEPAQEEAGTEDGQILKNRLKYAAVLSYRSRSVLIRSQIHFRKYPRISPLVQAVRQNPLRYF